MNIYNRINDYIVKGTPIVVVTTTAKQGEGPVEVGKKMVVTATNEAYGTVGGGALEYNARELCKEIFIKRESFSETYYLNENKIVEDAVTLDMVCGGKVTLYYEYIGPKEHVYIFGAGHVSQALTNVIQTLNYHITIIDERKEVCDQFKGDVTMINKPFVTFLEEHKLATKAMVVVCTPSHKHDYNVLNYIIKNKIDTKYIGMLCSSKKLAEYIDYTRKEFGTSINLKNFYSPIGLDLGGGSPEEIAISIASEMLLISHNKKAPAHMRDTQNNGKYRYWED